MAKAADTTSTSDQDADTRPLSLDYLIGFGRYYLEAIEQRERKPLGERGDIELAKGVLKQYLIRANEALALLQSEQTRKKRKKPRATGGRPKGTMGDEVLDLRANGMGDEQSLRTVEKTRKKSRTSVLRSLSAARKKLSR